MHRQGLESVRLAGSIARTILGFVERTIIIHASWPMANETARVILQTKPTPHESTSGVKLLGVIRDATT